MNRYYARQYAPEDQQRMDTGQGGGEGNMMGMMGPAAMSGIVGGQSLDDIVNQNAKEMRRRSVPVHQYGPAHDGMEGDMRRVSIMEFGAAQTPTSLGGFSFEPPSGARMDDMMDAGHRASREDSRGQPRRMSSGELTLNTRFGGHSSPYTSMAQAGSTYPSPLHPSGLNMDVDMPSHYPQARMGMPMDLGDPSLGMVDSGMSPMNVFQRQQFASPMMNSPMQQDFASSIPPQDSMAGNADREDRMRDSENNSATPEIRSSTTSSQDQVRSKSRSMSAISPPANHSQPATAAFGPEPPPAANSSIENSNPAQGPWDPPPDGLPSTPSNRPLVESQFKNAYSATGFDMLGVLMRVATRPKPEIDVGSVDLSCAFTVCDAQADDFPIVYCSENFERLTGYSKHMILGRNCRFLQSPDGKVKPGVKRKYVDDESVLYLKKMISARKEAQVSLINYRFGGQPFMNLLTMIPISWDTEETRFFVGFQVDLVEQPNSVTRKNSDGSYSINYQRGLTMPKYVLSSRADVAMDLGQSIGRDEVSAALSTIGTGDELSKRIWDKILLENTDDVVHVLSLKGLFLYLSPSSRKVLEYEPSELVGTALSSVCHPSDIVPVTRELKDTSSTMSVNVVFRIRRKKSGYMWFEGHGSLRTEQGKGRKCIIMVGRERPVYTLCKTDLLAGGGIGDNELWTKMSTSGMFLFVSANVRQMLDRQPEELVGTSIQALMRPDSKTDFARILELARTGKKGSVKHEVINKRGQVLQAYTTVYSGDAQVGHKPTFLVAQTRLLKFSRASQAPQRPPILPKQERDSNSMVSSASSNIAGRGRGGSQGETTPNNSVAVGRLPSAESTAITVAGQNGLPIGHQDDSLASEENVFDELKTTRSTSWQYELRQMEKRNRLLAEEVQSLLAAKKKRKRRKGAGPLQKDCANCHTRVTPEWRRGPSGNRDLCNSCGLRYAKQLQNGRPGSKTSSKRSGSVHSDKASKASASPQNTAAVPSNNANGAAPTSVPSSKIGAGKASPHHRNFDDYTTKISRMDIAPSQNLMGQLPQKIEEGAEPD